MISELANYCEILEEQYLTLGLDEIPTKIIDDAIKKYSFYQIKIQI